MSHFIFMGIDRPGMEAARARLRDSHRARLREGAPECRCVAGGPLTTDGGAMCGTLLIFEAEERGSVERFVQDDPYVREGLFEQFEVRAWWWTLGAPGQARKEETA